MQIYIRAGCYFYPTSRRGKRKSERTNNDRVVDSKKSFIIVTKFFFLIYDPRKNIFQVLKNFSEKKKNWLELQQMQHCKKKRESAGI
jgi:hypothetical protein